MKISLKTGTVSVNKYGDDHYDINFFNKFDKTISTVNFITRDELINIRKQINNVLKEGADLNVNQR